MKTKTTIEQEATMPVQDESPAVVAYRVGKLETTSVEEFRRLNEKIDGFMNNFAAKEVVHDLDARVKVLEKVNRNTPLVEKVVFTGVGLVLFAVAGAIVGLVVVR